MMRGERKRSETNRSPMVMVRLGRGGGGVVIIVRVYPRRQRIALRVSSLTLYPEGGKGSWSLEITRQGVKESLEEDSK